MNLNQAKELLDPDLAKMFHNQFHSSLGFMFPNSALAYEGFSSRASIKQHCPIPPPIHKPRSMNAQSLNAYQPQVGHKARS